MIFNIMGVCYYRSGKKKQKQTHMAALLLFFISLKHFYPAFPGTVCHSKAAFRTQILGEPAFPRQEKGQDE